MTQRGEKSVYVKKMFWPDTVAHAYNPSVLGGEGGQIA